MSLHGLVVRYPGRPPVTAVDGVDLELAPGGVLALLGPSGCGKSSLLRAVAGLEPVAAGSIAWRGEDLAGVPTHRRGFGLVFQDGQLFGHRTVAGNVAYGLRGAGDSRARVAELLELVGLPGYGDRPVGTLSGGERQRVALARSLAPRPRLLLLDEPLSALDRDLRERLADDLRAVLVATGTTALFVTHDQDEAATVADRVAVMSAGRLVQSGSPEQLWAAPADAAVARFLGYRTALPGPEGTRVVAEGGWSVQDGDLPADHQARCGDLVAAVVTGRRTRRGRPEVLAELDPRAGASGLDGAPLAPVAARPGPDRVPGPGERVWLRVDPHASAVLTR
nr:ABC transporter ATP-binding protein [Cellulomonas denverensis]